MHINLHCSACVNEAEIEILRKIGIEPKIVDSLLTVFDVIKGSEEHLRLKSETLDWREVLSWYVFSEEDMNEAEWFVFRSTNWKLENCALEKTFERRCKVVKMTNALYGPAEPYDFYHHLTQKGPFYFKKPIRWGRNFFYSCDIRGFQTLFCNDVARAVLTKAGLSGMSFEPALLKKDDSVIENFHQFCIDETIPDSHVKISGEFRTMDCPVCGKPKYIVAELSRPMVARSKLGDKDFYITQDSYTYDVVPYPGHYWIASKKAYLTIKNNGMDNTLEFSPLLVY